MQPGCCGDGSRSSRQRLIWNRSQNLASNSSAVARVRQLRVVAPSADDAAVSESNTDPDLILADDFSVLDPGWGAEAGNLSVKDKSLIMKPKPGYVFGLLNQAITVEEIDAAVKVKISDNDTTSECAAGIIFWAVAADDYFIFKLDEHGGISVSRLLKNR